MRIRLLLLIGLTTFLSCWGCGREARLTPEADKPIPQTQAQLLDLAFETASQLPHEPHIKTRSRSQFDVIQTGLELDQPFRMLGYIDRIDNWRKGLAYAELAYYCAKHDFKANIEDYLQQARQIAETTEDWRRDRIRVTIARTYTALGQPARAEDFNQGLVESEQGKIEAAEVLHAKNETFEAQLEKLDPFIASENFDLQRNALEAYTEVFNRYYTNQTQRSQVEEKIKTSWDKMPVLIRIELILKMAEFALNHGDQVKALELVDEAQQLLDTHKWPLEYKLRLLGKLAEWRHKSGDPEAARAQADTALELFRQEGESLVDIFRAEALRPVAEAYQVMGETESALAVYKIVVEEGARNVNSRPRAVDLAATCASLALHGVNPDEELWSQIRQIKEGLGQPW